MQSIAQFPVLDKKQERRITLAFREFQRVAFRNEQEGDSVPMSLEAAFCGVVKQLLREMIRDERSVSAHQRKIDGEGPIGDASLSVGNSEPRVPSGPGSVAQISADVGTLRHADATYHINQAKLDAIDEDRKRFADIGPYDSGTGRQVGINRDRDATAEERQRVTGSAILGALGAIGEANIQVVQTRVDAVTSEPDRPLYAPLRP